MDYILAVGTLIVLLADMADHLWPAFATEGGKAPAIWYADE